LMVSGLGLRSRARHLGQALRHRARKLGPAGWIGVLATLGVMAVVVSTGLAALTNDAWLDDLLLEVAKAGVWIVAVGAVGGALAVAWESITASREAKRAADVRDEERRLANEEKARDQRRIDDQQLRAELVSLVALYNQVKAVRRSLRSLGLDPKYPGPDAAGGRSGVLTEMQAQGFQAQMLILNGVQLDFEAKARQFGQTDLVGPDTARVVQLLGSIENHLNQVLSVWETNGYLIQAGSAIEPVSVGLEKLFRVSDHLRPMVSDPLREVLKLLNRRAFGEATPTTKKAYATVVDEHQTRE